MIPKETVAGLRIPIGRFLGIFPRYHKAALFFNFDEQPKQEDKKSEYTGDITVHGHTMYLGSYCGGIAKIDWETHNIRFESSTKSAEFVGRFNLKSKEISGLVTLRGADNLDCDSVPVRFREIT